jgi:hypothetical protein
MAQSLEEIREISPRDRTDEQHNIVHEFHKQKLAEFYHSWGVGDTDDHKTRFWQMFEPNVSISHFEPGQPQWVRAMEMGWMTDNFPQDMVFC